MAKSYAVSPSSARLAQQLLHHGVVLLRPEPAGSELPAVDDIADQINRIGIVIAQEIEQPVGLAAARAEMNVGDEERTEPDCAVLKRHESLSRGGSICSGSINSSDCRTMTARVGGEEPNAATSAAHPTFV